MGKRKIKIFKKKINTMNKKNLQLNINKAKKKLFWKPKLSISESIKLTIEWYKEGYNL